jgi:hypothetical protein
MFPGIGEERGQHKPDICVLVRLSCCFQLNLTISLMLPSHDHIVYFFTFPLASLLCGSENYMLVCSYLFFKWKEESLCKRRELWIKSERDRS